MASTVSDESRRVARVGLAAVAAGNFMIHLALMPVSTVLPTVAVAFGVDAASASWVMNAFLLTLTGLVLTTGRLGDLYGHRRVFLAGIVLFAVGAMAGGLASGLLPLVLARALQGIGGALMMGSSLAIVLAAVEPSGHGRAIALSAIAASLGSLVGVVMASFLLPILTWRAVFLAVAPVGLLTYLIARHLPVDARGATRGARPDIAGAALLFALLTTLSLSFSHLHGGEASFEAGWPYHTGMQVVTAGLLAAFIIVETRARTPMMPLHLFRHRRFSMAILANCTLHMTMLGTMFLVPFLIEQGLGRPPSTTGALLIPMQLASMAASYLGGWLYDRTRSPLIAPVALALIGVGLGLLGLQGAALTDLSMMLILVGVGMTSNVFAAANNTAAMSALPASLAGFASGMLETSRQLGHTVAVALAAGVLGLVAEHAAASGAAQAEALQSFTLAILSFSLVAFVGVAFALFGGEARRVMAPTGTPAPAAAPPGD